MANMDWEQRKKIIYFCSCTLVFIAFLGFFYQAILVAFSIGLFLTYLLAPSVDWLQVKIGGPQRRSLAVLFLIFVLVSLLAVLVRIILPVVYQEILSISSLLPQALHYFFEKVEPLKLLIVSFGLIPAETLDVALKEWNMFGEMSSQVKSAIQQVWLSTPSFLGGMLNTALIPLFMFFLLRDLPLIRAKLERLIPSDIREPLHKGWLQVDNTLRSILKGQVVVAAILGVLYMFGLSVIGLKSALAIGAVAGICRIVPYLDVVVGVTLSLVVIITQTSGFTQLIGVMIVFLVVQTVDGMFITPRIIGTRAGLHPAVVIASILAFGDWFGFWGVLIAIPVIAVITVLSRTLIDNYRASTLYISGATHSATTPVQLKEDIQL